jgi:hypothetical protein
MIVANISSCLNAKTSATLKQMALLALNKSSSGAGLKNPAGPCRRDGARGGRSCGFSLVTHFFCYGSKYIKRRLYARFVLEN